MGLLKWTIFLIIPVIVSVYIFGCCRSPPTLPNMADGWWGQGNQKHAEKSSDIKPYKINVTDDVLNDLRTRLLDARIPDSLSGEANFEYGFHSTYMKELVEYWLNKYDWRKQEALLNSYPQYMTNIEGIDVHFIHVKPSKAAAKVRPLLLIHGWPGSVWEFYKIIPMLTSVNAGDVSLELVIPSIPGYGFSEAPHRRGFGVNDAARIFSKLMTRLGHKRYYVQGGDWGAAISKTMAQFYDSNVIGCHVNMLTPPLSSAGSVLRQIIAPLLPSLVYSPEEMNKYMSIKDQLGFLWREFGYLHLQATRPDGIAYALNDSPIGLAAYILEKFSVWTDPDNRFCADGCLTKQFTLDELITDVMIYWVTGSIGSSMRFYKETMEGGDLDITDRLPVKVPMGMAAFRHEIFHQIESVLRAHYDTLVHYTVMPTGGHFAAMEQPQVLAEDIRKFIALVEKSTTAK